MAPSGSPLFFFRSRLWSQRSRISGVTQDFLFRRCLPRSSAAVSFTALLKWVTIESSSAFSSTSVARGANLPHIVAWKALITVGSFSFSRSNLILGWVGFLEFLRRVWKVIITMSWSLPTSAPGNVLVLANLIPEWNRFFTKTYSQSGCDVVHLGCAMSIFWMAYSCLRCLPAQGCCRLQGLGAWALCHWSPDCRKVHKRLSNLLVHLLQFSRSTVVVKMVHLFLSNMSTLVQRGNDCRFGVSPVIYPGTNVSTSLSDAGARWLSGRVSDSEARGRGFETYLRRVVFLSKTLYSPKVLVNYTGSGGSVPTWKIVDWVVKPQHKQTNKVCRMLLKAVRRTFCFSFTFISQTVGSGTELHQTVT